MLVVDDSAVVRALAQVALEKMAGWEVVGVESGAEALASSAGGQFDAALLDVEMPDMDGAETLRALRAEPLTAALPVVLLTGHSETSVLAGLEQLDVAGIISKPFEVHELADAIADLLGWER